MTFLYQQTAIHRNPKTLEVVKADILIYEGRVSDLMNTIDKYYTNGNEKKLQLQNQLYHENTTTMDEKIAAVGGHEIEHATSEENQALSSSAPEKVPNIIETDILIETKPITVPKPKPIKDVLQ